LLIRISSSPSITPSLSSGGSGASVWRGAGTSAGLVAGQVRRSGLVDNDDVQVMRVPLVAGNHGAGSKFQ
jgi:hypothetical protein